MNIREELKQNYTSSDIIIDEIIKYTENSFLINHTNDHQNFPLEDEAYVQSWLQYEEESKHKTLIDVLSKYFYQFSFPIKKNISLSSAYKTAQKTGSIVNSENKITHKFKDPDSMQVFMHQSLAGQIPVITIKNRTDFERFLQTLLYRNEPVKIPASMGAVMVNGLINWHRLHKLQSIWKQGNQKYNYLTNSTFKPDKKLYLDKFIVLCEMPYSNISCWEMCMDYDEWIKQSMKIRLEHEVTHFFTKRYFGTMRNNLHDELLADYMGICAADGTFKANWFLKFMGLHNFPIYRKGNRMENYLGNPKLSDEAFIVMQKIVFNAALQVEQFDHNLGKAILSDDKISRLISLSSLSLVELASEEGAQKMLSRFNHYYSRANLASQ